MFKYGTNSETGFCIKISKRFDYALEAILSGRVCWSKLFLYRFIIYQPYAYLCV